MRSIFLTVCGPAIYQLIRDLLSPAAPTTKSFAELVALVKEHQQSTPSFIVQRYHFYTRVQQLGESIIKFMAQLRKLAHDCQFGTTLEDMLRDRLVCGCRDKRLQYKLLADKALTYETAIQIAQSSEMAEKGAKALAGGATHKLYAGKQHRPQPPELPSNAQPPSLPCYRCGAAHVQATCRFKTASCHYCQKQGHLASVCRKKARDLKGKKGKNYAKNHQLEAAPNSDSDDSDVVPYPLFYSATPRPKPIEVSVLLSNVETTLEIDTGPTFSIISEDTYKTLWQSLRSSHPRLDSRPILVRKSVC